MNRKAASVAAAATSVILVTAAPAALIGIGTWPTPTLPSSTAVRDWIRQPLTTQFVIAVALVGAAALAALLVATILARTYTRIARALRWLPTLRLPGPLQGLTAALLGATAVTTTAAGIPAHAALATGTTDTTDHQATAHPRAVIPARDGNSGGNLTLVAAGREYTHTVRRGDTLSEIAEQWLGDPDRWPEIFALNRGTHFTDVGGTLRNPNIIYPGWILDLPADATPPAGQQPRPAPPQPPGAAAGYSGTDARANDRRHAPDGPGASPAPETPTAALSASPAVDAPTRGGPAAPSSPANAASDAATASPTPDSRPRAQRPDRGVSLPSGSWVDLGLALAIAAAVALVWAHRQRRYIPRQPSTLPRQGDPNLAAMPRVVGQIRRALPRTAADQPDTAGHNEYASHIGGSDDTDDPCGDAIHSGTETTRGDNAASDAPLPADPQVDGGGVEEPAPVAPALAHPLSQVWPPAGLGLTGPGTEAAARGFLTAALAAGALDGPDVRTQVVMPSATAATLLGAAALTLPRTPRLTITASLDDALDVLEAQTLHRTRLVYQHEVDTVCDLRATDPYEEPLPPIMLLADAAGRHERARVAALLTQGQRLDIHGVLLGAWPDGNTITVADDGTTTRADSARHGSHPADVGRLAVINPTETIDILATLAESHTGQPPEPAPAEPQPSRGQGASPPQPSHLVTPVDGPQSPSPAVTDPPAHAGDSGADDPDSRDTPAATSPTTDTRTAETDGTTPGVTVSCPYTAQPADTHGDTSGTSSHGAADNSSAAHPAQPADAETAAGTPARVEVSVLGAPGIVGGDPQRSLRAKSLELLVYLAVRDGSASAEAILDDLLPDAPASKALHRLHTYVSDLRSVLRHNAGPGSYLTHPNHRYQLNPERFDIDLWRMRAAITAADTATTKPDRIASLRRAVDAYRQPLANGCTYDWLEPYRKALRQQALDATVALVDELTGQPAEQLTVLDAAITHHPYAEGLYQAAMRARAHLGDLDALRALRRTVTRRLAEIDAEPSDDTLAQADRLTADLRRQGSTGTRRPAGEDGAPT